MKIAILVPHNLAHSSKIYLENITIKLSDMGNLVIPFTKRKPPKHVDVYWEPSTGRNGPSNVLKKASAPVVVTFHGVANMVLPIGQCFGPGLKSHVYGYKSKLTTYFGWKTRRRHYSAVIAVSEYAKREAQIYLGVPGDLITPIHHGVDCGLFHPGGTNQNTEPYLLHISAYQPKKNLNRIIAAYLLLPEHARPRLKIVAPGYYLARSHPGVEFSRAALNHQQVAALYQNALGFIFPSLHETFGLPIIDAMACGCPVITSNHPGCLEIAGDAALIVNPYSIGELADAMKRLTTDTVLRNILRDKGIEHAKQFTWEKSAEGHLAVFAKIIQDRLN